MYYTQATIENRWLAKNYRNLQVAFGKRSIQLDSPSKDGFVRRLLFPSGRVLLFTADSLPLNSAASQSLASDKLATYQVLEQAGILIPKGIPFFTSSFHRRKTHVERHLLLDCVLKEIPRIFPDYGDSGFRVIVKPGRESRSFGVRICRTISGIRAHANFILGANHYGLIQEFIDVPEYRVTILDSEIVSIYRKPRAAIVEEGKPRQRRLVNQQLPKLVPLRYAPEQIKAVALSAHKILGLRISGVDVLCAPKDSTAIVLEVNSNPGLDFFEICYPALAEMTADLIADAVVSQFC